jgi:hypothetical protein
MLSLVLFAYDPIAVWTLVVAVATLAVAIAAAWATFHYGRKAPTQDDLRRVEQHTSHLPNVRTGIDSVAAQMKRQEEADTAEARARLVSISVTGEAEVNEPLPVWLSVLPAEARLTRIELLSELRNSLGTMQCDPDKETPPRFVAMIPTAKLSIWRSAGTAATNEITRQVLRVWISVDERSKDAYREMGVTLTQHSEYIDEGNGRRVKRTYRIQGSV